jgi:mRNA interferase MazF
MKRGDLWWAELPVPRGSEPGFRRPVLIVQSDPFNQSRIRTVLVAVVSSNAALADAPGNVFLPKRQSHLPKDSVVNVSQLLTLDRSFLTERLGKVPPKLMAAIDEGLRLVLGV